MVMMMLVHLKLAVLVMGILRVSSIQSVVLVVIPREIVFNDNGSNTSVTFMCREEQFVSRYNIPSFEVLWTKDEVPIVSDNKFHPMTRERQLIVSDPNSTDAGSYKCLGKDRLYYNATGILHVRPTITSLQNQTAYIANVGVVNISITGMYDYIKWTKGKKFMADWPLERGEYSLGYKAFQNGSLVINEVRFIHNGTYRVEVRNKAGSTFHDVELTLKYPKPVQQEKGTCGRVRRNIPDNKEREQSIQRILNRSKRYGEFSFLLNKEYIPWFSPPITTVAPPKCLKVWTGETVELNCKFAALPFVVREWQETHESKFKVRLAKEPDRVTARNGRLVIKNITLKDRGRYTCKVQNFFGRAQVQTRIKVYDFKKFCGTPVHRAKRIADGSNIVIQEWPWQVLLTYNSVEGTFCGGVVIHSTWVITAFHCLLKDSKTMYRRRELIVQVGVYNRSLNFELSRQKHHVKKIHYPSEKAYSNDFALLELNKPIFFSKSVRPICLSDTVPDPPTKCEVSGWGKATNHSNRLEGSPGVSDVLQKATVPLVHSSLCRDQQGSSSLPKNVICSGFLKEGPGACTGDSGGPLACKRDGKDQWALIGVVSGGSGICGEGYTHYVNIVSHLDWIRKTIAKEV